MKLSKMSREGIRYWHNESWTSKGLIHGFVGNDLDVTKNPGEWLNTFTPDSARAVLLLLEQVHGTEICEIVGGAQMSRFVAAAGNGEPSPKADGWLIAGECLSGQALFFGLKTADCLPALLWAEQHRMIAALHCGWRGACLGLLTKAIMRMVEHGAGLNEITLTVGPGAHSCCYRIGENVVESCNNACRALCGRPGASMRPVVERREGGDFCNLYALLENQAYALGIEREHIALADECTICNKHFFSYRRQKTLSGRQLSFISPTLLRKR